MYTVTMNDGTSGSSDSNSSSTILGFPYGENSVQHNLPQGNASLSVISTSFNTSDATLKLQQSVDGTNWADVENAVITIEAGASKVYSMVITNVCHKYYRTSFDNGTNSAGTFVSKLTFN